jgi:hypothetical protein
MQIAVHSDNIYWINRGWICNRYWKLNMQHIQVSKNVITEYKWFQKISGMLSLNNHSDTSFRNVITE